MVTCSAAFKGYETASFEQSSKMQRELTLLILLSAAAADAKPFPSWIPGEADLICAKFDYYYHRHFDGYSELILNRTENYKYDPRRERLQGINMLDMNRDMY